MRYQLINGEPVKIQYVRNGEAIVSNPTDEMIDELEAGYRLKTTEAPQYDPETQRLREYWELQDGFIQRAYAIEELTVDEQKTLEIDRLNAEKEALNLDFEAARNTPIEYEDGRRYYPRYVQEYWAAI